MSTKSSDTQIMTPEHPRWIEFYNHLSEMVYDSGCEHTHNAAEVALKSFGFAPEEIEASVRYFREHGGHCSCEVLLNVGADSTPVEELDETLFSPEGQKQARCRERAYRKGFTHGIEAVRRIAAAHGELVSLAGINDLADVAMEMRFDGRPHPTFLEEVLGRKSNGSSEMVRTGPV